MVQRPTPATLRTLERGLAWAATASSATIGIILGDIGLPPAMWRRWHFSPGAQHLPDDYRGVLAAYGWPLARVVTVSESGLRDAAQRLLTRERRRKHAPEETFPLSGWAIVLRDQPICGCDTPHMTEALVVADPDRDDDAPLAIGLRGWRDSWIDGRLKIAKTPLCALLYAALVHEISTRGFDGHVAHYETEESDILAKLRGGAIVAAAFAHGLPSEFSHQHHVVDSVSGAVMKQTWRHDEILEARPPWPSFLQELRRRYPDIFVDRPSPIT